MTWKYWGPATQPTTTNHPPKPNQPLVNQLEVLEPSLGLDLIDSQSSYFFLITYFSKMNTMIDITLPIPRSMNAENNK